MKKTMKKIGQYSLCSSWDWNLANKNYKLSQVTQMESVSETMNM
jgi:hypothetical protein